MTGNVKWFNAEKGFGFIRTEEEKDIFVHYSQIVQDGYKSLNEGEAVRFEIFESEKGLQAKNVERAQHVKLLLNMEKTIVYRSQLL